jgi:hypothetical protein
VGQDAASERHHCRNTNVSSDFMKKILTTILLTTMTLLTSCQDRSHIAVTGQITDESSGKPIPEAEVVVLCWYMHNIDDASFKKQTLKTDKNGNYRVTFDKGHQVDVASQARDFLPNRKYNKLEKSEITVDLKLKKSQENSTLVSFLNTDIIMIETTEKTPFLRHRIQNNKITTYGFDFTSLTTKTDTAQCDLWFKVEKSEKQPTTIVTNRNGGIIPILSGDIESSLLYEKVSAPTTGYKPDYTLKGDEEGFFIKYRDGKTYAKIILEKATMDVGSPMGQGTYYKELGRYFSYLYQPNGTTDLSYSTTQINLEDFLVDYRLR